MPVPQLSIDELVSTLKKSNIPTLIVEGTTDAAVYRLVERRLSFPGGTILSAGSRATLLHVYERRGEFPHIRTAFLADRDMWLFGAVPPEYAGVVFTSGYSIENDLLDGEALDRLCDTLELSEVHGLLMELCKWFAFEIEEWRANRNTDLDVHVNKLIPLDAMTLSAEWLQERRFREPNTTTKAEVHENPRMKIRGKQVLDVFVRVLSRQGRKAKFSRQALVEICATSPDHKTCTLLMASLQRLMGKKD